ncbi:hypothetical protein, partial [Burkholderia pseudomallei]|uniref:hypothetical protein n=1 Tax=Burkholderia pseudomallei TaxID=28450 RepID=UPI001604F468
MSAPIAASVSVVSIDPIAKAKGAAASGAQIADKPSPSGGVLFFNGVMLKTPMPTQHELEMVTLEELVPKDH